MSNEITTCGIFLFNKEGKFLIGHPTDSADLKHDFFSIPKGWRDEGESNRTAAHREVHEETNIFYEDLEIELEMELDEVNFSGYNPFTDGHSNKTLVPFFILTDMDFSEHDIKCESLVTHLDGDPFPEIDEFRWVTIDEGLKLLHHSQISSLEKIKTLTKGMWNE